MYEKVKRFFSEPSASEYTRLDPRPQNDEASTSTRQSSYGSFNPFLGFFRNTLTRRSDYQVLNNEVLSETMVRRFSSFLIQLWWLGTFLLSLSF